MASTHKKDYFNSQNIINNLKEKSIKGGIWITGTGIVSFGLRLIATAILARLLVPQDFGLISMVTAITVVADRLKDLGFGIAIIQSQEITHEETSNLFWINALFGISLMLLICVLSKCIALFYNESRLTLIAIVISTTFGFYGICVQHTALLRRKMEFGKIAGIELCSETIASFAGISSAYMGYGYWSIVIKEISRSILYVVFCWTICHWIPSRPSRKIKINRYINMGKDMSVLNLVDFTLQSIDQLLIGKFFGARSLGIYRQAYQLIYILMSQIIYTTHVVSEPALSVLQTNFEKFRDYFTKILTLVSFISMPIAVFVSVCSNDIVFILLGEQWMESATILSILCVGFFIKPIFTTIWLSMVTTGQSRKLLKMSIVNAIIMVLSMVIGIHWGMLGIAIAVVVSMYIIFIPNIIIGLKNTPVNSKIFFSSIWRAMVASILMAISILTFHMISIFQIGVANLIVSMFIGAIIYISTWSVLAPNKPGIRDLVVDAKNIFKKDKRESPA